MNLSMRKLIIAGVIVLMLFAMGCSGNGAANPTLPGFDTNPPADNPPVDDHNPGWVPPEGRQLWGMWNILFDEVLMKASVQPLADVGTIFDEIDPAILASFIDCLDISVNRFEPSERVLYLDVKLRNTNGHTGYDVRGVVYMDEVGHELRNPEGWTPAFDIPAGTGLNPYKAFAKEVNKRVTPASEFVETYAIHIPETTGGEPITFAVDGSWYDEEDEQYYAIEDFRHSALYIGGSPFSEVFVDVHDWEGIIDRVTLELPLITGQDQTKMERISENTWWAIIKNNTEAGIGDYEAKVTASSSANDEFEIFSYEPVKVTLAHGWAQTWGGPSGGEFDAPILGDRARDVETDAGGNVYAIGTFYSTSDFDPGERVEERTAEGEYDIYMCKFGPGGLLLWVNTWGGSDTEYAHSLMVDDFGYVYVSGYFEGMVDFDPGTGVEYRTAEDRDVFLSKFNPYGEFKWVITFGGPGYDYGRGLATDGYYVYMTGNFDRTTDFDPGPDECNRYGNDGDAFLAKYYPNGELKYVRTWGGLGYDYGADVIVSGGNVYVTGSFEVEVDFKPGSGKAFRVSNGGTDAYLTKFQTGCGNYGWTRTWGGVGNDFSSGIAVRSDGSTTYPVIYVTGGCREQVVFDKVDPYGTIYAGPSMSTYLAAYYCDGSFRWADCMMTYGGGSLNSGSRGVEVDIDSGDNIYVTGCIDAPVEFISNPGLTLSPEGGRDAFVAKYTPDGFCAWAENFGGTSRDEAYGLSVDPWDNVYISGFFWDEADLEPGEGGENFTSNGNDDAFLIKLMVDGS